MHRDTFELASPVRFRYIATMNNMKPFLQPRASRYACGTLAIVLAGWTCGCMAWRPDWPGEATRPSPDAVAYRMAEAERLATAAAGREGVEAAIAGYGEVLARDSQRDEAHVELAHLHLLIGDGYTHSRSGKRAHFRKAMHHAEAAMFANADFRERIRTGEPTWVACGALGVADIDAMFFWVNAVFYQFKETLRGPSQMANVRWIRRARQVMDHMATLAPDPDFRIDFLFGAYYLSIPTAIGGDRERSAAYFNAAVANAPNMLLPRWGRAKYYHTKMNNPEAFREDLTWVITRSPDAMHDHPAWRHFFIQDARRMLAATVPPFNHHTGRYRRRIREHWPSGHGRSGSLPVVVVLHGAFSTGRQMEQWGGWSALAEREGVGVILPEGIGVFGRLQHWNAGHCCGRAVQKSWDDVAFLDAVIDYLRARPDVDAERIMMVGFSNGGMMVHRYAAERPERLAAAAVVSGALNSLESPGAKPWTPSDPAAGVPILLMHGTADVVVPIAGGMPRDGRNARDYAALDDAVDFWSRANQAVGPVEKTMRHGGAVLEETCHDRSGRGVVAVYRIEAWGHQWPGGPRIRDLPQEHPLQEFDAADIILDFFRKHGGL